ncbi:MAG: molybdopterin-binding protein [Ruminococcus sp.]|uniref:molybdopterin-binding protein n=1 Tax=Ruminococcus sp. TaxID=41978 RepID=UPI00287308AB|nr:molybdopterin-binding protein [Ruminococcus sp.]MBQ3285986.1 molybdopterin-binding protein [Ruminococcus sp.]
MKLIKTIDAVGHVLCHDMTQIIPGEYKGARFRKGHIVTEEDIPVLLSMGKENLYIYEMDENKLHENDAAEILCKICKGQNISRSDVKEGKTELKAEIDGLFTVNRDKLNAINSVDELMIATRKGDTAVHKGDKLAGTRVIPLVIDKAKLDEAERIAGDTPIMSVLPYRLKTAGIITTGSEVFHGRIEDRFTPVLIEKLKAYGIDVTSHILCDDDAENIKEAIKLVRGNVDMILCTGGMSVDPDDNTPGAIKLSGADIVTYGAPVLPGAMFLLGYYEDGTPVMGLPGCVMYAKATIFELVLPRIAAGVRLSKADFVAYGEGGLCLGCTECTYPHCAFGK